MLRKIDRLNAVNHAYER